MPIRLLPPPSNRPDLRVIAVLSAIQRILLPVAAAIAGVTLCAWLIPSLGDLLPPGWQLMKANTAVLTLLSALSLTLSQSKRSNRSVMASRFIGAFVALFAAATIIQYIFNVSLGLDTLLAADPRAPLPGRMSAQAAASFAMLGIVLFNLRVRKAMLAHLTDALILLLSLTMLVYTAGYVFGAMRLFGSSMQHRISPQTIFCLCLLTFLALNRRTEYGIFSILVDDGIGGKTARLGAPCAVLLPFTVATIRGWVTRSHLIPEQYGVGLASALMSLLTFCFILFLSGRCRRLEAAIRELSLRDQLTQLYNRRGFLLLADQGLRLASRAGEAFFLLFIDMDHLKQINDALGHEVGSDLLQEMAQILKKTFRESDVIGRIGGDEFVVAGNADHARVHKAVSRLEDAANNANRLEQRTYALSFSLGYVVSDPSNPQTLEHMLQQADSIMYEAKRSKKQALLEPAIASV